MLEAGSFRDRKARVYRLNNSIYRGLDADAYRCWQAFEKNIIYTKLCEQEKLVNTHEVPLDTLPQDDQQAWAGVLQHDVIPCISYPYEWSFSRLKAAALFHLDLLSQVLAHDFMIKDSSSFNIQFQGSQPLFIDIASFEPFSGDEPWVGYRQFCEMFLNPLLLHSYKSAKFQPWLRGNIDGIEVSQMANLCGFRDLFRKGVFSHIYLHAKLQRSSATGKVSKQAFGQVGFNKALIVNNLKSLQKLITSLKPKREYSEWLEYAATHSYADEDYQQKIVFVEAVVKQQHYATTWDLGCNTGDFSRIAAKYSDYVVALDFDEAAVDALYLDSLQHKLPILALVMNLSDPSPNMGWRGQERLALSQRSQPDLILVLALIHHLVISANIPLPDLIAWLAGHKAAMVIEYVDKKDDAAVTLLQNKADIYLDYSQAVLERCLNDYFTIHSTLILKQGLRVLYYVTPK